MSGPAWLKPALSKLAETINPASATDGLCYPEQVLQLL